MVVGMSGPTALVVAACLHKQHGNSVEQTMVADTMTRLLPRLKEKLPNAGPS